jgi:hypothetical protein
VFRLLGGAGGGVRHVVVLAVLSGRVPSRERTAKQSSLHGVYLQEGKSLLTLKFSAKRSIFTRKRMLND